MPSHRRLFRAHNATATAYPAQGIHHGRAGRGNIHNGSHFYATYRRADGKYVIVGAIEPQFYALLLDKLGLAGDARFAQQ